MRSNKSKRAAILAHTLYAPILFTLDSHSKINLKKSVSYRHIATREISDSGSELDNITCNSDSSCMGKCSTERDPGPISKDIYCFCDEHCMVFQDCCADYEQACLPIGHQNSSRSLDVEQWQCNDHIGSVEGAKGVWMISTCPANWIQDGIAINCTGNAKNLSGNCQNFAPVTDEKGNTYKNRFCALCHGVEANANRFYDAQLVLNVNNVTQSAYNTSRFIPFRCSYLKWKPPLGVHRRYCLELTKNESCLNNSSRLQDHTADCLSRPPGIVKDTSINSKLYFNRHCALCAGVPLDSIACVPTKPRLIHGGWQQWTFSDLLSPEGPEIKPCQDGHVLDPVSKKCKKALKNAKPSVPFLNRYTTTVQFRSRSGCEESNRSETDIRKSLESALKHCSAEVFNIDVHCTVDLSYSARITVAFLEANITHCNLTIRNTSFLVIKGKWEPMLCAKIDIYKPGEYVAIADADSAVYINGTGVLIQKIDYWSNQTRTKNGSVVPLGDIHVCRKTLGCSGEFVQLEESEYVILPNGSLYRSGSHVINDFVTVDGKPAICITPSDVSSRTDVALVVISNVGIGLSVVCLLLVLITYSLFKELRTVPGVNLMNLCLSLLFAHSLLMAVRATHIRLICTSIAVLLHYFFLSSFVWMSIIAFDTYRTFSRTCHTRQGTGKLKARFLALGWLPVLVFVAICFSLDQSGLVAIGYGGRDHCWTNNPKTNTFVFVIPVAFSILFNGLFFLLTVISIRKIKKQTKKVESAGRSRRSMVLFAKLAVLMGFTWIFGYLMILVSNYSVYFEYPFVIFTSLQGVYIAVGFVFTARVKKMYDSLFSVTIVRSSSASSCETHF